MWKKLLTITLVIALTTGCASIEKSTLLGVGVGAAAGTGIGIAVERSPGSALIGTAIGAVIGGALFYLGHKGREKKIDVNGTDVAKKGLEDKTPFLTQPDVRRVWVPEHIDGNIFEEGHYKFVIERNSVWSK